MGADEAKGSGTGSGLLAAVVLLSVLWLFAWWGLAPAPARTAAASATAFSAERALVVLERLMGDGAPRPMGSWAHAATRKLLVRELEALGYEPKLQQAVGCGRRGACGTVHNVVARRPGWQAGPSVLIASHYDTQPHTPGAADAGAGVASLVEIARALSERPPGRHPVVLLATDGEERGMLGAAAFLEHDPAAADVGAVINLEARGTTGRSLLVATGPASGGLVGQLGAHCPAVVTSSFVTAIASRLPASSDFFLFAERGLPGVELAFVEGWARHHTPLDDLAHLDPVSVQQQGACALALANALAAGALPPRGGERVFFSLPALGPVGWLVGWPVGWTLALALLSVALVAAAALRLVRRGDVSVPELGWGLSLGPLALAAALTLSVGLGKLLRLASSVAGPIGGVEFPWTAHPAPAALAFWAMSVAGSSYVAVRLAGRAGFRGLWCGAWLWCASLAVLAGLFAPRLSFPVLVPALLAGVAFWLFGAGRGAPGAWSVRVAAWLPLAAGSLLIFQLLLLVQRLSGTPEFAPLLGLVVAMASPLFASAPTRARLAVFGGAALVGIAATVVSVASPSFDAQHPREISLRYVQGADGEARWEVNVPSGVLPDPLASQLGVERGTAFGGRLRDDMTLARMLSAEAPRLPVSPPELELRRNFFRNGLRHVRVRLRSTRGAPELELCLTAGTQIEKASFGGELLPLPGPEEGGGDAAPCYAYANVPPAGVELELAAVTAGEIAGVLRDFSPELPELAAPLVAARPPGAVPRHAGDRWVVEQRVRF